LLDRGILFGTIFGIALHPLIIGFLLRQTFGATLHLLPTGGYCTLSTPHAIVLPPSATHTTTIRSTIPCHGLGAWTSHLILPWLTFAIFFLPLYVRLIRARVLETFAEPHVATARVKGASELHVILRHVLRPALVPLTPMVAMDLGGALMTAIYLEVVFALGGIGNLALRALSPDRSGYDLPLIASIFFVVASLIVVLNLVADVVQGALDPRVRTAPT
jgi:peptide/nickel transport system permease protein